MTRILVSGIAVAAAALGCSTTPQISSDEVAAVHKRDFHARGQAGIDRIVQDEVQKVCTETDNNPSEAVAKRLEAEQLKTIAYPSGGLMGDWKKGEKIAQSGRGMTWSDKPGSTSGGGCYNCHQLAAHELSYGTLGPSLQAFGKVRGNTLEAQRYVYGKIYNAKAYNLCSNMPRFGNSNTLSEAQIKDLVAYLLDPASPVNQ